MGTSDIGNAMVAPPVSDLLLTLSALMPDGARDLTQIDWLCDA